MLEKRRVEAKRKSRKKKGAFKVNVRVPKVRKKKGDGRLDRVLEILAIILAISALVLVGWGCVEHDRELVREYYEKYGEPFTATTVVAPYPLYLLYKAVNLTLSEIQKLSCKKGWCLDGAEVVP